MAITSCTVAEMTYLKKYFIASKKTIKNRVMYSGIVFSLISLIPSNFLPTRSRGAWGNENMLQHAGILNGLLLILSVLIVIGLISIFEFKIFKIKKDLISKQKLIASGNIKSAFYAKSHDDFYVRLTNSKVKGIHIPSNVMPPKGNGEEINFEIFEHSKIFIRILK